MKPVVTDPYCYPGTRVLINLRDLQDRDELDTFESDMVTTRLAQFKRNPITGPFNLKRLQETHRRIFQDVYPWAGSIRQYTGTMSKTRANGTTITYCDSNFIMNAIAPVFAALEQENFLRGLDLPKFATRAAHFYGELDAVHAFREGNSRTLRQFFADLAREAGYKLDWRSASDTPEKIEQIFLARDAAVMRGDSSLMAKLMEENLKPL
jgi:cell filamentation protein